MTTIPNFNLDLPNVNGDDNTWGDLLNTILEDALDHYVGLLTGVTAAVLATKTPGRGRLAYVTDGQTKGLYIGTGTDWEMIAFNRAGGVLP